MATPLDLLHLPLDLIHLGHLLPLLELGQFAAQHLHGGLPVLDLAALILALHHDTCGQMGNTDSRLSLIDVLAARAAAAIGVHAQFVGINDDFVVVVQHRRHI